MKNLEIANIFYSMADILEIQGVEWKPRAYRKAAKAIESLAEDIEEIYKREGIRGLKEIPGVGEKLALKIEEFLQTGRIREYERLKKELPTGLADLIEIPTMGPKKAYYLYKALKIRSIADLERAAREHKIAKLRGFGPKSEENILRGIELFKRGRERPLLGTALGVAQAIVDRLKKIEGIDQIEPAGSLRRRKETVGDIDILVTVKTKKAADEIMDVFTSMPDVVQVLAKGPTKSMVILKGGIQSDVRVVAPESFGSALQYFTGSKDHNIELRKIAIKKGYKLSEYGIFDRKGRQIAGRTEEEIYAALGLPLIPPELRENWGEIEAAQAGKLPKLVDYEDIKGDFHVHTKWSDGDDSIEEIARAAQQRGYVFICIADHSKSQKIAHGLEEERLLKQIREIKELNKKLKGFRIFASNEVDIKANGDLDYPDEVLKQLDFATAAVHSGFKMPKEKMTERILTAMENKYVRILAHPTGRIINKRPPYELDVEKIFDAALDHDIALEIDAFPDRLDLSDGLVKQAIEKGVKIVIGTDAHSKAQLHYISLGVATARRGWAEKEDILNTYDVGEIEKFFKIK